jgi:copper oxidase (laccase) domain-containing protein
MMITLAVLDHGAGVRHAFFTRQGGVSGGLYESLNCGFGSGDATESVARNRGIAMEQLSLAADRLVTCRHGGYCIERCGVLEREAAPRADGWSLVPTSLGVLPPIVPILFQDPVANVIGAGMAAGAALGGVVEATIEMEAIGASEADPRGNRPFIA